MGNMAGLGEWMPLDEAALVAVLGYLVVFVGLILLMFVISGLGKCRLCRGYPVQLSGTDRKEKAEPPEISKETGGLPAEVVMMAAIVLMESSSENANVRSRHEAL